VYFRVRAVYAREVALYREVDTAKVAPLQNQKTKSHLVPSMEEQGRLSAKNYYGKRGVPGMTGHRGRGMRLSRAVGKGGECG